MSLSRLLELDIARLTPQYAASHAEHDALRAFPTLPDLVRHLGYVPKKPSREARRAWHRKRSRLLCPVVLAYQATRAPLWSAILVAAFLKRIQEARLSGLTPEDREAIFFSSLFRIAGRVDVRAKAEILDAVLWRRAKKAVVRKLEAHAAWSEVGFGEEGDENVDRTSSLMQPFLPALILSPKGGDRRPELDLVLRVHAWGSLAAYVAGEFGHLPAEERATVYRDLWERWRESRLALRRHLGGGPVPIGTTLDAPDEDADVPRPVTRDVTRDVGGGVTRYVTRDVTGAVTRDEQVTP